MDIVGFPHAIVPIEKKRLLLRIVSSRGCLVDDTTIINECDETDKYGNNY